MMMTSCFFSEDCPEEPQSPVNGWVRRDGSRAVIGCHTTSHSWNLVCIRRRWVGDVGNCTESKFCHSSVLLYVLPRYEL